MLSDAQASTTFWDTGSIRNVFGWGRGCDRVYTDVALQGSLSDTSAPHSQILKSEKDLSLSLPTSSPCCDLEKPLLAQGSGETSASSRMSTFEKRKRKKRKQISSPALEKMEVGTFGNYPRHINL